MLRVKITKTEMELCDKNKQASTPNLLNILIPFFFFLNQIFAKHKMNFMFAFFAPSYKMTRRQSLTAQQTIDVKTRNSWRVTVRGDIEIVKI
jgi:hypothetical protein